MQKTLARKVIPTGRKQICNLPEARFQQVRSPLATCWKEMDTPTVTSFLPATSAFNILLHLLQM